MTNDYHGLLVLDKPSGITSRDAVNRVMKWFPRRTKIGHTGTLDPLATGVLVLCIGNATRLAEFVQGMDKTYRTTIVLGARSDTDDADGTVTPSVDAAAIEEKVVRDALGGFIGAIKQTPPAYSAIKVGGKRAHDLARRGDRVEIAARTVQVYGIELRRFDWPELDLEIRCGKGTYIRSLARDLGKRLGCGAYVKSLRRTQVGSFTAENAVTLESSATHVREHLQPSGAAVAHLPSLEIDAAGIDALRHGQPIAPTGGIQCEPDSEVALIDAGGELISIGRFDKKGAVWPVKVFPAR